MPEPSAGSLLETRAATLATSVQRFLDVGRGTLEEAAGVLGGSVARGGTIFACGNGGSAAHAAHFEAELVGRFREDRAPLPAIYLGLSASAVTAIANDFGLKDVFARPLTALCRPSDALLAISTSGTSPNVTAAIEAARRIAADTVLLTGPQAPDGAADVVVRFPGDGPDVVQEGHQLLIHVLVEAIETATRRA
jgi:D-sedoheptulose 7-phosphate isomerase